MRNGLARAAFGYPFEEFAYLEEQHNKHCLREFRFRIGQEAYGQGAYRGNAHQEVFVHRAAVDYGFAGLFQGVPADYQIGDHIHLKILPHLPVGDAFDVERGGKKDRRQHYLDDGFLYIMLFVVVMMVPVLFALAPVVMMMFVSHILSVLWCKDMLLAVQPGCKMPGCWLYL